MKYLKIKPQNDMVLLQYLVKPKYTPAGLILPPESGKDDPAQRAKVLAKADNVTCCNPGDLVYVFISDGVSIERLYRSKYRKNEGDIKLYKSTAILCIADESTQEELGKDLAVIEAHEISDLVAIKESDIKVVENKIIH